jgi:hypothetical protein
MKMEQTQCPETSANKHLPPVNNPKYYTRLSLYIHVYYNFRSVTKQYRGRDSSVDIETRYGLDDPEIEFRCGARFPAPVQTGPRAHTGSYIMGTGSFPGVKLPRRGVDNPPPIYRGGWRKSKVIHMLQFWACVGCSRVNLINQLTVVLSILQNVPWRWRNKRRNM